MRSPKPTWRTFLLVSKPSIGGPICSMHAARSCSVGRTTSKRVDTDRSATWIRMGDKADTAIGCAFGREFARIPHDATGRGRNGRM